MFISDEVNGILQKIKVNLLKSFFILEEFILKNYLKKRKIERKKLKINLFPMK